jgi:asparagine synthase (glutamine-hydrolysing)
MEGERVADGRSVPAFVGHVALAGACTCDSAAQPIVDSAARAPVSTRTSRTHTVHLAGQLHARGELASSVSLTVAHTDHELFAAAWDRWGEDAPVRVHGEYAAAVVESTRSTVTLVRDHIGTHPLFWHTDGRCVCFATSMPLLLSVLPSRPAPDEERIAGYLFAPSRSGSATFLQGVQMVEPGHLVVVGPGRTRTVRWWRPEELEPIPGDGRALLRDDVRELVALSVADRLPSGGPVGVHFSGGIDSTLVSLYATEQLAQGPHPLRHAYTWSPPFSTSDPDLGESDERHRLAALAAEMGLDVRHSARAPADMLAFLRRPIELEGTADVFDELPTIEAAARDGVAVLLSGWGGDELLSVHTPSMPAHLLRNGRLRDAARALRNLNGGIRPLHGLVRITWRHGLQPMLPGPLHRLAPFYTNIYRDGCYVGPTLQQQTNGSSRARRPRLTSNPKADLLHVLDYGHVGERMATWQAWGAPHGVVHRYPLTDRRLTERVLRAPTPLLWADGWPRYPARVAIGTRTRTRMVKADPANERQRHRMREGLWAALGDEVRAGALDGTCDWVDLSALRADVLRGPVGEVQADVLSVARMMPALRVLDLWRRHT